jgi:hypothetical protein
MQYLQLVSIILEAIIVLLLLHAVIKGKKMLAGLALTFAIYVGYDLAKLYDWEIAPAILSAAFFIATIAALFSVWNITRQSK